MTCIVYGLTERKGSDSAPHPVQSKKGAGSIAAGCFTQPWCTALVIGALEEGINQGWIREEEVTRESIEGFLSGYGRAFYKIHKSMESDGPRIRLERRGETIPEAVISQDGSIEVVPFRRGKEILSLSWKR
jgi:dihydroorotase